MARKAPLPTVFVDSNILISSLVAPASPAGVLVLWSSLRERPYAIVVADFVRLEVEQALASRSTDLVALFRAQLALFRPLGGRDPGHDFQALHASDGRLAVRRPPASRLSANARNGLSLESGANLG